MASDLKFEITFSSNGEPVIKNITGALDGAKKAAEAADVPFKSVAKSAASAAIGMLDFGVAGNAAGNALQSVLLGAGPAAGAMAAVAVAVGVATYAIDQQRKKFDELAEAQQRQIFDDNAVLKYEQAVKQANKSLDSQIDILQAADPELETIAQKYKGLNQELSKLNDPKAVNKLAQAQALETNKLLDARLVALAKEQAAVQQQIAAAQDARAAFGLSGAALIDLNTQQKINAILTSEQAEKHGALTRQLADEAAAMGRLQAAQSLVDSGRKGVGDFQSQFGVVLPFEAKFAGEDLASKFAAVFNTFKNDANAQGQLAEAFRQLVTKSVQIGVPDIGELLGEKIGSANFERLRAGLGDELKSALDASAEAGQQWGATFADEFSRYSAQLAAVGARTQEFEQRLLSLQTAVVKDLAMSLDVSQPLSAIDQMRQSLNSIPAVTHKQVVFDVFYAMSPQQPFSQFLPAVQGIFSQLQSFVPNATPEILFEVPNLRERIDQINSLMKVVGENSGISAIPMNTDYANVWWYQQNSRQTAANAILQIQDIQAGIAWDVAAAQAAAPSAGGSGGGGVTVNVYLDGPITSDALDDALIPALASAIIQATGADPEIAIHN